MIGNSSIALNVENSVQKACDKLLMRPGETLCDAKRTALGGARERPKTLKKRLTTGRKKMKYSK